MKNLIFLFKLLQSCLKNRKWQHQNKTGNTGKGHRLPMTLQGTVGQCMKLVPLGMLLAIGLLGSCSGKTAKMQPQETVRISSLTDTTDEAPSQPEKETADETDQPTGKETVNETDRSTGKETVNGKQSATTEKSSQQTRDSVQQAHESVQQAHGSNQEAHGSNQQIHASVQQIRDSLNRFLDRKEFSDPRARRTRMNISILYDRNDSIYVCLMAMRKEHIADFKKYAYDSPLIVLYGGPTDYIPEGKVCENGTLFTLEVSPRVYPTDVKHIEMALTNHTRETATAGEDYVIQYENGSQWEGIPQCNWHNSIGYPIRAGKKRDDFQATLFPELQSNPPGRYRVFKTVHTGRYETLQKYVLCDTFLLSDRPEEYQEYTDFVRRLYSPRRIPQFQGGQTALEAFLRNHLRYPEAYRGTGLQARLCYSFTVDSLGNTNNLECLQESIVPAPPAGSSTTYPAFREEAVRVIRQMPPWLPAVDRKKGPVAALRVLCVQFKEDSCGVE